jgi:aspartate oxidase
MRAGAEARDLEFVQWHPTRLDSPVPLFITNGLLADGAVFRDAAGREFMADYDPRGNLAPRDVLAKAVYLEAAAGRGVNGGVYLDCSSVPAERISLRHAHLDQTLQKHGIDLRRDWLAISPATHFSMGGITIDCDAGATIAGCFAAGETAGGLHGANRLGGNAFCEGLVFGTIAGEAAARWARSVNAADSTDGTLDRVRNALDCSTEDPRSAITAIWHSVRQAMWDHASIVRDAVSLTTAMKVIDSLTDEVSALRAPNASGVARILDLQAALDCARATVAAALFREESRGAHWRSDFPDTSDAWMGHTSVRWAPGARQPKLQFHPRAPSQTSPPIPGRGGRGT